jgi:hypothetical protein
MVSMKNMKLTLQAALFGLLVSAAAAADRSDILHAINLVENPSNSTGYGPCGELGPYQFRSSTWHMYSQKPFRMANDRASADEVAARHYEWIRQRLTEAGIDANVFNIAMAWNCGLTAVVSGHVPEVTYHYAEQVRNLAESFADRRAPVQVAADQPVSPPAPRGPYEVEFSVNSDAPRFAIPTDAFHFAVVTGAPDRTAAVDTSHFVLAVN